MSYDKKLTSASVYGCSIEGNSALVEFAPRSNLPESRIFNASAKPASDSATGEALKRAADIGLAIFLLPFVLTVGAVIFVLIALGGGNPFFGHKRIGRNGVEFECLKFRTMQLDAQERLKSLLANDPAAREEWAKTLKLKNDPRVTPIGKFLRKTSLDELPQLWNVIRGEMSFVGPRPITSEELSRYGESARLYLACKPGITGLWQIHGRNDVDYASRVALDARYARERSTVLDLRILLLTIPVVLGRKGAY